MKVEEYLLAITYIAGYICFAINKKLQCIYSKSRLTWDCGDVRTLKLLSLKAFHGVVFYYRHHKWFALL